MEQQPKVCGSCKHWHRQPSDPTNLGAPPNGQCREGPPHATTLPGPQGGFVLMCNYPGLPANYAACSRHALRLVADDGEVLGVRQRLTEA